MSDTAILLVPLLILPVVLLLAFAGCSSFTTAVVAKRSYADEVRQSQGLVAYWRLSEPGGNTAEDSGPQAASGVFDGTYRQTAPNGFQFVKPGALEKFDPEDRAVEFDGNGWAEVKHDPRINPQLNFTVELWVRLLPRTTSAPEVLFASRNVEEKGGFSLALDRSVAGQDPVIRGRVFSDATAPSPFSGFDEITLTVPRDGPTPAWHYIVFTFRDGTLVPNQAYLTGTLSLFAKIVGVGGIFKAPQVQNARYKTARPGATAPLRIGAGHGDGGEIRARVAARMDEVALYNVALGEGRVESRFSAATAPGG